MPVDVTFYQPSWVQIEATDVVAYVDPAYLKKYYTDYPGNVVFSSWPDPIDGLPERDMPTADVIAVTHHHKDHCKSVTVERLRGPGTTVLAPHRCVEELGEGVTVVEPGSTLAVGEWRIEAVYAYNTDEGSSARKHHERGGGVGYCLDVEGTRIYHAGDTDLIPEMEALGGVDLAFLPIGGGDAMDAAEAVATVATIDPTYVVPMHDMGASREDFAEAVEAETDATALPLGIGGTFRI